jgi:hypothetical protein
MGAEDEEALPGGRRQQRRLGGLGVTGAVGRLVDRTLHSQKQCYFILVISGRQAFLELPVGRQKHALCSWGGCKVLAGGDRHVRDGLQTDPRRRVQPRGARGRACRADYEGKAAAGHWVGSGWYV